MISPTNSIIQVHFRFPGWFWRFWRPALEGFAFEVDGSIIELLRVGHFVRAYPNKDWGAHKIKTSVLTFVYIFYTCAEGTVI
jgi:hypothetical protein